MTRFLVALFVGGCLAGCAGLETGQALRQSKIYEWKADGGFWVEGRGSQEEKFRMGQGVEFDPQGNILKAEYWLEADPSADEAAAAFARAYAETQKTLREMLEVVQAVLPIVLTPPADLVPDLPSVDGVVD